MHMSEIVRVQRLYICCQSKGLYVRLVPKGISESFSHPLKGIAAIDINGYKVEFSEFQCMNVVD